MDEAPRPSPSPRFTLAGLLELIAGIGLFLALVTQLQAFGLVCALVGLLIVLAAHYVLVAKDRPSALHQVKCLLMLLLILLSVIFLWWCLVPTVYSAREIRQTPCQRNLRQLKFAFEMYHQKHGNYPPPYVADSGGRPMHSWRAILLPYLDEELAAEYDLSEPWDGPHNRRLASRMPAVFRCPSDKQLSPGMTSYFCVVGPGRFKPGATFQKESDFTDELTILLVESNTARVNWLEPRDLTVAEVLVRREAAAAAGVPPCHHGDEEGGSWRLGPSFNCAMDEGFSAWSLRDDIAPEALKRLLTIDGGESIEYFDLMPEQHLWPGVWVLLGVELVFVVVAILRRVRIARRMQREAPPDRPSP